MVYAWDVVNEPFNENGTFRDTLFHRGLGQGYIARALRAARAADPSAELYINDYNTDGVNAKSTALYNLVGSLRWQGVPIDGVGLQAHLVVGQVPGSLRQNIERFAALGLDVAITELDVRMPAPPSADRLATQAADYAKVADAGWNAAIPAAGSVRIGLNGVLAGASNPVPTVLRLNGVPCSTA